MVEAMDLEHALDFERLHDAVAKVDADVVHVRVLFELPVQSVVAKVAIDLSDTARRIGRDKTNHIENVSEVKKNFKTEKIDTENCSVNLKCQRLMSSVNCMSRVSKTN